MALTVVTRNVHGTSSRPAYRCWIPRCRNGNATSPSRYTEDNLVQRTTAEYLAEQLGWESVYAHNHEDFGPESLLGRASEHEVVLVRTLRRALAELNPGRPEAAFDDAIRQLTATIGTQSIVVANRAMYALIRDGVPVTYRNDEERAGVRIGFGSSTSNGRRTTTSSACESCGCGAISTGAGRTSSGS